MECIAEQKRLNATESGTEQFTEMVEKYQRNTFDDDERQQLSPKLCEQSKGAYTLEQDLEAIGGLAPCI